MSNLEIGCANNVVPERAPDLRTILDRLAELCVTPAVGRMIAMAGI